MDSELTQPAENTQPETSATPAAPEETTVRSEEAGNTPEEVPAIPDGIALASDETSAPSEETNAPSEETTAPADEIAVTSDETSTSSEETPPGREEPTAISVEANAAAASWWDALAFEGKEHTALKPDGSLMLKATPFSPERVLQQVTPENASAITRALSEKFREVEAKVQELAGEWTAAEDKTKLAGRVARVRDYLLHAAAIGDFTPLYQQVALWDNTMQEGMDKAYADRLALVERAEAVAAGEPTKEATQELRDLGDKWKGFGSLDKERADALWNRLEAAKNGFFDRKRERHEAEQAEMSSNLDLKTELVEKAERAAASDSWKQSTELFKTLMDQWKTTGRTFNDKNEALWQRFIAAKNVFYDRKKQHFESIQTEQDANYEKKLALITQAEGMSESTDWNKTSNAYNALMDEWKSIGRVPVEKADELWDRLSKAKDVFFNAKREHFATLRVSFDDNYAQKMALVKRAESLQHSNDWRDATDEFGELLEDWKKIGPVARRDQNEALWESFIQARKAFFKRKDDDRDRRRATMERAQAGRVQQTQEMLSRLREELKEDEENLADYHLSMGNLGGGKKDDQIRANLERLIAQSGPKMEKRRAKIAEVEAQLTDLTKTAGKGREKREDRPAAPKPATQQPVENAAQQAEAESSPGAEAPLAEAATGSAEEAVQALPEEAPATDHQDTPVEEASPALPQEAPASDDQNTPVAEVSSPESVDEPASIEGPPQAATASATELNEAAGPDAAAAAGEPS